MFKASKVGMMGDHAENNILTFHPRAENDLRLAVPSSLVALHKINFQTVNRFIISFIAKSKA